MTAGARNKHTVIDYAPTIELYLKPSLKVGQLDKLPAILKTIKDAVLAGELDAEIGLIAKERVPTKKLKAA